MLYQVQLVLSVQCDEADILENQHNFRQAVVDTLAGEEVGVMVEVENAEYDADEETEADEKGESYDEEEFIEEEVAAYITDVEVGTITQVKPGASA